MKMKFASLSFVLFCHFVAGSATTAPEILWFDYDAAVAAQKLDYEEQVVAFTFEGLVNNKEAAAPTVLFQAGTMNYDWPGSDAYWRKWLTRPGTLPVMPSASSIVPASPRLQYLEQAQHAFLLQSKSHDRIGSLERGIEIAADAQQAAAGNRVPVLTGRGLGQEFGKSLREQAGRSTEHNICATGAQGPEIRASHT